MTPGTKPSWLSRRIAAFADAGRGLAFLLREPPAQVHLFATIVAIGLSLWLKLTAIEWSIIALTIAAVWSAEAFNTAIEKLADALHPGRDPRIGAVKDLAAAAVLFTAISALAVAGFIFGPKLIAMFG